MKICPRRLAAIDLAAAIIPCFQGGLNPDMDKFDIQCIEGLCAQWIASQKQCAITTLAQVAAEKTV